MGRLAQISFATMLLVAALFSCFAAPPFGAGNTGCTGPNGSSGNGNCGGTGGPSAVPAPVVSRFPVMDATDCTSTLDCFSGTNCYPTAGYPYVDYLYSSNTTTSQWTCIYNQGKAIVYYTMANRVTSATSAASPMEAFWDGITNDDSNVDGNKQLAQACDGNTMVASGDYKLYITQPTNSTLQSNYRVSWINPLGSPAQYIDSYFVDSAGVIGDAVDNFTPAPSIVVGGSLAEGSYTYEVTTTTSLGDVATTTMPTQVSHTNWLAGFRTIKLSWTEPSHPPVMLTGYKVYGTRPSMSIGLLKTINSALTTTFSDDGSLNPGTGPPATAMPCPGTTPVADAATWVSKYAVPGLAAISRNIMANGLGSDMSPGANSPAPTAQDFGVTQVYAVREEQCFVKDVDTSTDSLQGGAIGGIWIPSEMNQIAANNASKFRVCQVKMPETDPSSSGILSDGSPHGGLVARLFVWASWALLATPRTGIIWWITCLDNNNGVNNGASCPGTSANKMQVMPEVFFTFYNPIHWGSSASIQNSYPTDITSLLLSDYTYAEEFKDCYNNGVFQGSCIIVVRAKNTNSLDLSGVPFSWFSHYLNTTNCGTNHCSYLKLAGGSISDTGTASLTLGALNDALGNTNLITNIAGAHPAVIVYDTSASP